MKPRITLLLCGFLAAAGCEHPSAFDSVRGPAPVAAAPHYDADDARAVARARETLRVLVDEFDGRSTTASALPAIQPSNQPRLPAPSGAWLKEQSATLHALAERSRVAAAAASSGSSVVRDPHGP